MAQPLQTPPLSPPEDSQEERGRSWEEYKQALNSLDVKNDFTGEKLGSVPCLRKALLFGIAGGFGVGGIRLLFSRQVKSAANWSVFSFAALSVTAWEDCRRKRTAELNRMKALARQVSKKGGKGNGVEVSVDDGRSHRGPHGVFLGSHRPEADNSNDRLV